MALPKVLRTRRVAQWTAALVTVAAGVQFTLWVVPHLKGQWPTVARPPAVEAFLPIGSVPGLRHLLHTGSIDPVHPARLAICLGICLMPAVLARSFCSHLCPIGLLSELLGQLGLKRLGRTWHPPRWLNIPLRSIKFLLLGFFIWAIWYAISPAAVAAFLEGPYAVVVDAKMWLFFAEPTRLTIAVVGILVVGGFRLAGSWHTAITEADYHERLPEVGSGAYAHPGGYRVTRSEIDIQPEAEPITGPGRGPQQAGRHRLEAGSER